MKTLSLLKTIAVILILAIAMPLAGCKKKGCTEKNALNYDSKAKNDDESCEFSNVVFHVNTPWAFTGGGITTTSATDIKVDGVTVGNVVDEGSFLFKLNDGNTHTYESLTTVTITGSGTTNFSESGSITANPNQQSITIELYD